MMFVQGCKDEIIGLWRGRWLNTRGVRREKKVFRMERSKRWKRLMRLEEEEEVGGGWVKYWL